ncbi:MAG TPA: TIGR03790 family protein [Bryobacteraceae bacterium]|nr:TIGR03790 family protein [Bryobacteraceae bacterium]
MTRWPHILKSLVLVACLSSPGRVYAEDDPLAASTLTVYVTNSPDSVAVKDHYIQARYQEPSSAPVCGIALPDPNSAQLNETEYINSVKTPIRDCLNEAGRTKILYIVLAYVRPFALILPRGIGYYSLDSYLADIWDQYTTQDFNTAPAGPHGYYADAQNRGNVYAPFVSLQAYRAQPRSLLIYSVWRLDGATPAIARGLVDKATQNMNTLSGAACIDRNRGDLTYLPDSGYGFGDWDLRQAAAFLASAGITVTEDDQEDEFGRGAAPPVCPASGDPVAFYSGWYSLNNYNGPGVFNWAPGAIGFHLDSNSLKDPRGGSNWSANALSHGITVTSGAVYEPYLQGLPRPAGIYRNLLEGANVGDAFLRNTRWLKWMIANVGDPLYRPFPASGQFPFNPPGPENSFFIQFRDLLEGESTTATINLASPAPPAGLNIALSTNTPAILTLPESVTVDPGATSVSFPIAASFTPDMVSPIVSADTGSAILSNSVSVYPLLANVGLTQSTVSAGQTINGAVFLNARAPATGITVALTSTDPSVATVPASVVIQPGLAAAAFPVTTFPVASSKTTTIRASYNDTRVSVNLTAVPALSSASFTPPSAAPGASVLFEVYLNVPAPPGGVTVTLTNSNPRAAPLSVSSIMIPAGSRYGNAGFTAGAGPATATVQASYGGDTKSATFTVN